MDILSKIRVGILVAALGPVSAACGGATIGDSGDASVEGGDGVGRDAGLDVQSPRPGARRADALGTMPDAVSDGNVPEGQAEPDAAPDTSEPITDCGDCT